MTAAPLRVLGIESSCDETGVALVELPQGVAGQAPPQLLAHALHSQIDMHQAYGGVVPELASRDHIRRVVPLLRETLAGAGLGLDAVDVVAYTRGPGLAGALLVGSGALVQASGIDALTRTLRNAVIGAGIGAALKRTGLRLTWLRRGLRWVGVETEPERASEAGGRALPVSRVGGTLLGLGWAGTLVGIGLVWTGVFGG